MFQCGYGVGEKAPAAHTCSCGALARRILSQASFRCDLGYISTLLFSHTRSLHFSPSFAPSSSRADFLPTCTVQTPSLFRCSAPLRLPFSAKILPLLWLLFSILTRCPVHFSSFHLLPLSFLFVSATSYSPLGRRPFQNFRPPAKCGGALIKDNPCSQLHAQGNHASTATPAIRNTWLICS